MSIVGTLLSKVTVPTNSCAHRVTASNLEHALSETVADGCC